MTWHAHTPPTVRMTDRSALRNLEDKLEEILPTEKCFLGGKLPKKAGLKG